MHVGRENNIPAGWGMRGALDTGRSSNSSQWHNLHTWKPQSGLLEVRLKAELEQGV